MCRRDRAGIGDEKVQPVRGDRRGQKGRAAADHLKPVFRHCLLYTSDAADERSSVDLGGRRIIKKKKIASLREGRVAQEWNTQVRKNKHSRT